MRRLLLVSCCFIFSPTILCSDENLDLNLQKGVNFASWMANAKRQPLYDRDFILIKNAGFDHIRLPFNPEFYGFKFSNSSKKVNLDFAELDNAVVLAVNLSLPIIIDIHSSNLSKLLENNKWTEDQFISLWELIATHYKRYGSRQLIFELLNEPQYYNHESDWDELSHKLINAIHNISPDRIIVIDGPRGSSINGLSFLNITHDHSVIYSFHFYQPYIFTHQGSHMGFEKTMVKTFQNIPYPSDLVVNQIDRYSYNSNDIDKSQKELDNYVIEKWDFEHINLLISKAKIWAKENNVKIVCGEFGVLKTHSDNISRYRWIKDVRNVLDINKIPWEIWDYSDLMGITIPVGKINKDPLDGSVRLVNPHEGIRIIENEAYDALGLN